MNIHDTIKRTCGFHVRKNAIVVSFPAVFACSVVPQVALAQGDAPTNALIQQLAVEGSTGYRIIHEEGDESIAPRLALERFKTRSTRGQEARTTFALRYGWVKTHRRIPVRWRFSQDSIYMAHSVMTDGSALPGTLVQHRISELDSGRPVRGRAEGRKLANSKLSHLKLKLTPISQAVNGMLVLTETGVGPPRRINHQTVQYDFRILEGEVAELYMTVDGVLSKWQHDGKEWIHQRNFKVAIEGEFVVLSDGNAVVALRDKEWCVIENIADENPVVHRIAQQVEGEPLVVIHDVGKKAEYFEHSGSVYNRAGREVFRFPLSSSREERMASLVELVQSNRE